MYFFHSGPFGSGLTSLPTDQEVLGSIPSSALEFFSSGDTVHGV